MELKTGENDHERRLDRILRKALPDYPLSLIHRLARLGKILVDGRPAKIRDRIPCGAVISVPDSRLAGGGYAGNAQAHKEQKAAPLPHNILEILLRDEGLLILNKPAGLAVHGPDSLDNQVQRYLRENNRDGQSASISFRAGPLHRLDKPTSGVIVFSTSLAGARRFSELLREGGVKKYYLAIVEGRLAEAEVWEDRLVRDSSLKKTFCLPPSGGAASDSSLAITAVSPLAFSENGNAYTLVLAEIKTGKTHQIRCQAACHGHPLAGDVKYGGKLMGQSAGHFFLHAWKLEFDGHSITAPPPRAFVSQAQSLFAENLDSIAGLFQK